MNIQMYEKRNDTKKAFGESAGYKDADCQKLKVGDGMVCTGGLEGLDIGRGRC